jgi:hypothetical protein
MSRISLRLIVAVAAVAGCSGGGTPAAPGHPGMGGATGMMPKPGMTGMAGATGMPGMMGTAGTTGSAGMAMKMPKPGMTGTGGMTLIIGVPTPGSPGVVFPGGGPSGATPLVAGCTPASANECPSSTGACSTSSTSKPTGTTTGSVCFFGQATTTTTASTLAATIEYLHETAGGQEYYRFRITFDPRFVDNTYGANAIGWGTRGHTFKDLVGSDHAELALFDGDKKLVSMFDIDYITQSTGAACGYDALGVSGGEGKMLLGDSSTVLASTTSLDRNLNGCGYCKNAACGGDCTVDSPVTDEKYTINASAPNWDYRVIYEVWIAASAFSGNGFGGATISFVHASPSKASSNTVTVIPKPCGGCPAGTEAAYLESEGMICKPTGTSCPAGTTEYLTSEGKACKPSTGCPAGTEAAYLASEGMICKPTGTDCPSGTREYLTSEGRACKPGTDCPTGTVDFLTSEGAKTCLPDSTTCPTGFTTYLQSEGSVCVPTPKDGVCPQGFRLDPASEGTRCI